MRIALTYDLKSDHLNEGYDREALAELDDPANVEAMAAALAALGHEPVLVGNLHRLVERLAAGERWDLVFNTAEGLHGFGREAAVPALLDAYRIPYTFSDPLTLAISLHKPTCKRVVRDAGIPTPAFAVVESEGDLASIDLEYPLFAKPVAEGSSKGISTSSLARTPAELRETCVELLGRFGQAVLVERFLPGRELTVGLLGTGGASRCLGTIEIVFRPGADRDIYSYANKSRGDWRDVLRHRLVDGPVAAEAEAVALAAWRVLGGRDAGRVDLKLDESGHPEFLEANPLAGLSPGASDLTILCDLLGISYERLIGEIVESALARCEERALPSGARVTTGASRR
jgi:D-alanine-D-alanine ligase